MGDVTTRVLGFTRVSVVRKRYQSTTDKRDNTLCVGVGEGRKACGGKGCELKTKKGTQTKEKKKGKCSESSKASVQLGNRKLALPHRARATTGPTALPPWLLALVRVRKEGQRGGGVAGAVDDGYGRVAHRREVRWIGREAVDVRLVRFGRGQVRDELRQLLLVLMLPSRGVRRGHRGIAESVWVERRSGGLRTLEVLRGSPLRRGGRAFARWGIGALVALG